jgi:5-methylthioadenosine/S-adenosylhomocysteine deaminase
MGMATIEAVRAIGLGDEIGSLDVEKQADLILVDLSAKSTITWNQDTALISHLVSELVTDAIDG